LIFFNFSLVNNTACDRFTFQKQVDVAFMTEKAPEEKDNLQAAVANEMAYLVVNGRATFKICPPFKQFCLTLIESGVTCFVLDMGDCLGMDSTFMGVMAGLTVRVKEKSGRIVMMNLSNHLRGLIATLGLDTLVEAHRAGALPIAIDELRSACKPVSLDLTNSTKHQHVRTMLDAHETLVQLIPDNEDKFRDVLKYLREDVSRIESSSDTAENPGSDTVA